MASTPLDQKESSRFFDEIAALREIANALDPFAWRVVNGRPRYFSDNSRAKILHQRRNTKSARDLIQREIDIPNKNKIDLDSAFKDELPVAISPRVVLVYLSICLKDGLNISDELRDKISQSLLAFADWVEAKTNATR